ncbi:MAG TPA: hypothetical protein VF925_12865 [Casimicrobiaceae bacterium]
MSSPFALTTPPGGTRPHNTAEAVANLARDHGSNVAAIYALSSLGDVQDHRLSTIPDAWTVTVKVDDSGRDDPDLLIGGPGNLAFDQRGYAWGTNNVIQDTPNSSQAIVVLEPNGQPADGSRQPGHARFASRRRRHLGTGFGVTVDPTGFVWFGNFGWGPVRGLRSLARRKYLDPELRRRQRLRVHPWKPAQIHRVPTGCRERPFRRRHRRGRNGLGFERTRQGAEQRCKLRARERGLQRQFRHFIGQGLRGLSIDLRGNAWIASQGDRMVYAMRPDGTEIGRYDRGGINGPRDKAIDGDGNVRVANFGPLQVGVDNTFTGRLSELRGTVGHCPPGKGVGDALSPATGYTVPSAGSEVLLHNGDPLYGAGKPPSYIPMMRQTGVVIDRAGNIWSINNWKPRFDNDAVLNPGGDGIIIFVGLAPPPSRAR